MRPFTPLVAVLALALPFVSASSALEALEVAYKDTILATSSAASNFSSPITIQALARRHARKSASSRLHGRSSLSVTERAIEDDEESEAAELMKREVDDILAEEGLTEPELRKRALNLNAYKKIRCGFNNQICRRNVRAKDVPKNGVALCSQVTHKCDIGCKADFALVNGVCVSTKNRYCGKNACGKTPNGVFLCSGKNKCTLSCDTRNGYVRTKDGKRCFAIATDENNCGAEGKVCRSSYNGIGKPLCLNSWCRLACPAGKSMRYTKQKSLPYCR